MNIETHSGVDERRGRAHLITMKHTTVFWACLTAAAFAFLIGVVLTIYATNHRIAQADDQHPPPPAGDQFDEGPVLARLPGTSTNTVRFIF